MRVLLALVTARVHLETAPRVHRLADQLTDVDLDCFHDKCGSESRACSTVDEGCKERMSCLSEKREGDQGQDAQTQKSDAAACFDGMTLQDMSKPEMDVLGCAKQNGCLQLGKEAEAFLEAGPPGGSLAQIAQSIHVADPSFVDKVIEEDKPDY